MSRSCRHFEDAIVCGGPLSPHDAKRLRGELAAMRRYAELHQTAEGRATSRA